MAGRIELKFGVCTPKEWQSVLNPKKLLKNAFENLRFFLAFFAFFVFLVTDISGTALTCQTTLSPRHTPEKDVVWLQGPIMCFELGADVGQARKRDGRANNLS
jgi:hypothetical protein